MKYYPHRLDLVDAIMHAPTPRGAAEIGRNRAYPIRPDWDHPVTDWKGLEGALVDDGRGPAKAIELVKDMFMYEIVLIKFTQHSGLKTILLGTGTLPLVENALHDPYWGIGASKIGVNRLGKVLMLARETIKTQGL